MKKRIVTFDEFKGLVQEICRQIANDSWRPDYIVGLTRGGLLPATMISHYLEIPMKSLQVSLRDGGECVSDLGMAEDAFTGKNILIVDDINDQGSTINWIKQDWPSGCFPESETWEKVWGDNVRWAVVFDNLASQATVEMAYVGEEINKAEEDMWIQFPYEDWWK
jgi:hypoxanthine phosphoribosyltransferase